MPVREGGSWIRDPKSGELSPNIPAGDPSPADAAGGAEAPAAKPETLSKSGRRRAAGEET